MFAAQRSLWSIFLFFLSHSCWPINDQSKLRSCTFVHISWKSYFQSIRVVTLFHLITFYILIFYQCFHSCKFESMCVQFYPKIIKNLHKLKFVGKNILRKKKLKIFMQTYAVVCFMHSRIKSRVSSYTKFKHSLAQNRTTKQRYVDKYNKILSFFSFRLFEAQQ